MAFKRIIVFSLYIAVATAYLQAQDVQGTYTLKWHNPYYEKISEDIVISYLFFDDASLYQTTKRTPLFWKTFPVSEQVNAEIVITDQVWQTMSSEEVNLIDVNLIKDTLSVNAHTEYTRKVPALKVEFFPFRKRGNQYEKLLSFRLQGHLQPVPPQKGHKSRVYATTSILDNEGFYKISITHTGIHKITYDNLQSLGINLSSLSTGNIAVFGNGGRILPESTSDFVFDDLQEVAIEIVDANGNGIFEQGDYILFYGIGITNWNYDTRYNPPFTHELNFYTNNAYYFINVNAGVGAKKRVSTIASTASSPTHTVNSYYFYDVNQKEAHNVAGIGRIWFGDEYNYNISYDYKFSVSGISKSDRIFIRTQVAAKSSGPSNFVVNINNAANFAIPLSGASGALEGSASSANYNSYTPTSDDINIKVTYNKSVNSSVGWLDYIELHAIRSLAQHTGMLSFRNPEVVGSGNVANYQFDNKGKNTQVWDVTDRHNIKRINTQRNENISSFSLHADSLREFVAFDGSFFHNVVAVGRVPRQNLHGQAGLDFVIITHPDFLEAAEKLAAFRRSNDNMRVAVVTTNQVYNEFGSGIGDIGAIRNFLKMLYDRETADNIPKNVLLIGKTSYDFRNINGKNSCFIPNYQGNGNIFAIDDLLSTDNFFVKLNDGKGFNNNGTMDMGIGRFPVITNMQALNLVQKSINYASYADLVPPGSSYTSNFGNWKNIVAFAADDLDLNEFGNPSHYHMNDAEGVSAQISVNQPFLNIEKMYCDASQKVSSSGGARYPEITRAINSRINKGCLFFTYFGHGGDNGWAATRIIMRNDFSAWKNRYCLTFLYAACCTFAHYDKISGTSPSEDIILKTDGGAIAVLAATRVSSSAPNKSFGQRLYNRSFELNNGKYLTLGEVHAKAHTGSDNMYVLLGDPSATLSHPKHNVVTDSINGMAMSTYTDTVKALQFITIKGHITDNNNNILNDFDGWVYPTIYDKTDSISLINPIVAGSNKKFPLQKSVIFKGKSKVEKGYFSFSFMTPKDINYEFGMGKISYYATGKGTDANGYEEILIGGLNDTVINDDKGPEISLYFNDSEKKFINGGITSQTPMLHAKISDESGINTTGAGIGHDIVAIIDGDMSKCIILNDFFEYDTNSYVSGSLSYILSPLSEGTHTLTLRAWDIINNMGEETINFEVVKDEDFKLNHVLNYPNPFSTSTQFFFEHNRPNTLLQVKIQILTISGKIVKTIIQPQQNTGYRSEPIPWNGRDEFGDKLARGVYIYKLQVMTPEGKSAEKIDKIVIL